MTTVTTSHCFVTGRRVRDIGDSQYGKLQSFQFHNQRPAEIDWFCGEVCVRFTTWASAQKAVKAIRNGDNSLWDAAVLQEQVENYNNRVF